MFEITSTQDWQQQFDITVYQLGWRLGGKGASGRNPSKYCRNEEHGLHVWMGFYDNAFDLIRRCYDELNPRHGHAWTSWRQAFSPLNGFVLTESGRPSLYALPKKHHEPGKRRPRRFVFWHYAVELANLVEGMYAGSNLSPYFDVAGEQNFSFDQRRAAGKVGDKMAPGDLAQMFRSMPRDPDRHTKEQHDHLVQATSEILGRFDLMDRELFDESVLRYWELVTLGLAILTGIMRDGVVFHGFGAVEEYEWSVWMSANGASPAVLASAPVRACYDLIFGYAAGDPARRSVGAGTGTHCLLRLLFDYREAVAYELMAGMGESVFAPLYLVLRDRGVKFKFFHRVRKLMPTSDRLAIGSIEIDIQAELRGRDEYHPLISVKGLRCWPSIPLFDQLTEYQNGQIEFESTTSQTRSGRCELRRGIEFDDVILGIPLPALGEIAEELATAQTGWREMLSNVRSTATIAAQLWTTISTLKAGWPDPSTLLGGFEKPFDTVWDADKTIAWEDFPRGNEPKGVMYLCGTLPESLVSSGAAASALTEQWLRDHGATLWPGAGHSVTFDWRSLYDPSNSTGPQRLTWQHMTSNVDLSQRYVQSWPGTSKYRMWADKSGFANLYLAGDWVKTSLNAGCMEAAIMAGLRAARSITGRRIEISGEDELFPNSTMAKGPFNLPGASLAGVVGSVDAVAVILPFEMADVQAMIPNGLRLVRSPRTPVSDHPVGFLFCQHWGVRPALAPPIGGLKYHEIAVAIPYVGQIDSYVEEENTVLPVLLLDNLLATIGGRALFGFEKRLASISVGRERYVASRFLSDTPWITLETRPAGPQAPAASFPKLNLAREIFEQPVLVHHLGHWRQMRMDFGLGSAAVTPLTGTLKIHTPFIAGLQPREHALHSIQVSSFGAFAFSSKWELSSIV